ncbi:MAG: hypothetical protein AAB250_15895 [Bdellovibrionota bacterium]
MVATKVNNRKRYLHLAIILPASLVLMLAYQNCAVDMSANTPGAASLSCNPDTATLAEFETIFNNTLNSSSGTYASGKQKCAACHGDGGPGVNGNGEGGYIIYQGDTATDTTLVSRNFCASLDKGQTLVDRPMDAGHGGTQYPQSDIQDLVTFVRAHF